MQPIKVRLILVTALVASVVPQLHPAPARAATASARRIPARQLWSDPATWGGNAPREGDKVVVPTGTHVVLDTSPPRLAGLQVDGLLSFARRNVALAADWIVVHGTLRVGTTRDPFRQRAVITLTGVKTSADVMGMGIKVLGVMGGRLELHAEKREGWTRLDGTVERGGTAIRLVRPMPWRAGDRIVLASSDYSRQHDEERTVTAVDGRTLTLDSPLEYRHWGELQTFDGSVVDERAEVGLLTRNVVIRGDASSESDGFGGHLMAMHGARVRIDGVELDRMGQRNALRRYPVHFHMEGSASGSYLKRSSIHHSFNRCVVVHGTDGLLIKDNVCFEHEGHGFFLEDGAETDNVLEGNLGLGTIKVDKGLLPSDARPGTFWITNPDNVLRGNVAAGSDGTGFWYALPLHPTGDFADPSVWPRQTPLGEFSGNVAHSNAVHGLDVDHGPRPDGATESAYYSPRAVPGDASSPAVPARFDGLTAYMNRDRGAWLRGANLVVSGATFADNKTGVTFAAAASVLEGSVLVGETANPGTAESWEKKSPDGRALPMPWRPESVVGGFELYDGKVGVRDTAFAAFRPNALRRAAAITAQAPNAFSVHPKNFVENVRFDDSNRVWLTDPAPGMDGDWSKVFVDVDGSLTGSPGAAVVVDNPFLLTPGCSYRADWNGHVCASDFVSLIAGAAAPEALKPLTITRSDGVVQRLAGAKPSSSDAVTTILPNRVYDVRFSGPAPARAKLVLWRGAGRWLHITLDAPDPVRVTRWGTPLRAVASRAQLDAATDSAYWMDSGSSRVHVKLMAKTDWEEVQIERL